MNSQALLPKADRKARLSLDLLGKKAASANDMTYLLHAIYFCKAKLDPIKEALEEIIDDIQEKFI